MTDYLFLYLDYFYITSILLLLLLLLIIIKIYNKIYQYLKKIIKAKRNMKIEYKWYSTIKLYLLKICLSLFLSLALPLLSSLHLSSFFSMSRSLSGFESQDFDWADYLKHTGAEAAPDACFPNVRHFLSMFPPQSCLVLRWPCVWFDGVWMRLWGFLLN